MKDTKSTKKSAEKSAESREVPVGFFTTAAIDARLKAEAKKSNRSRSRHLHAILTERFNLA